MKRKHWWCGWDFTNHNSASVQKCEDKQSNNEENEMIVTSFVLKKIFIIFDAIKYNQWVKLCVKPAYNYLLCTYGSWFRYFDDTICKGMLLLIQCDCFNKSGKKNIYNSWIA